MSEQDYVIVVRPLSEEEGGGFLALVPDLHGCVSDGETQEEAITSARAAVGEWIDEAKRLGREIPKPGSVGQRAIDRRKKLVELVEAQDVALRELRDQIDALHDKLDEQDGKNGWASEVIGAIAFQKERETLLPN